MPFTAPRPQPLTIFPKLFPMGEIVSLGGFRVSWLLSCFGELLTGRCALPLWSCDASRYIGVRRMRVLFARHAHLSTST